MSTYSSILAWEIPCIKEPGGLQSMGCKDLDSTELASSKEFKTGVPGTAGTEKQVGVLQRIQNFSCTRRKLLEIYCRA